MTAPEVDPILSFEEFQAILAEELMVSPEALTPEASLTRDLQVDSLALTALMLRLQEMGVAIPLEAAWEIDTVGDAYRAFIEGTRADEG